MIARKKTNQKANKTKGKNSINSTNSTVKPLTPISEEIDEFPGLDIEKQTALKIYRKGNSESATSELLSRDRSIFYTWKKNDPLFLKYFTEIKAEIYETRLDQAHYITVGIDKIYLTFINKDWDSKDCLPSDLIQAVKAGQALQTAMGNIAKTSEREEKDRLHDEASKRLLDTIKGFNPNVELDL